MGALWSIAVQMRPPSTKLLESGSEASGVGGGYEQQHVAEDHIALPIIEHSVEVSTHTMPF